jgi:putative ABC transport system permease protein
MNRFALLTFFRSFNRHRLYAGLNIGGLAVGIAAFILLGLYVRFETSFEHWLPGYQDIYLVKTEDRNSGPTKSNYTPIAFWSAVQADLPGTVGTRITTGTGTVLKDGVGSREEIGFVDRDFPKVFQLPVLQGSLAGVFDDPSNIVLTEQISLKYFATSNSVGRQMTVIYDGKPRNYRVAAVLRNLPENTDLKIGMYARLLIPEDKASADYAVKHQWDALNPRTFVRLTSIAERDSFAAQLPSLVSRHARAETPTDPDIALNMTLHPIAGVHAEATGNRRTVATLAAVGLLTLLIAMVNYVNLSTALSGLRAGEVAVRKVVGANHMMLIRQFVGEAVVTTALAGVIGLVLAEITLPLVNAVTGLNLSIPYMGFESILVPLVGLILLVGIVAGIYPAIVLARLPSAAVLASARSPGGGRAGAYVREALIVFQFATAVAFIVGTMVMSAQAEHLRNAKIGFEREGLFMVPSLGDDSLSDVQRNKMLRRFAQLPGVNGVTVANSQPGGAAFTMEDNVAIPGVRGAGPALRFFETTPSFFSVMQAKLLAGRVFDAARPGDVNPNMLPENLGGTGQQPYVIVINRAALSALNIPSPQAAIGRTFAGPNNPPRTIIGVIEDMRFESPRSPVPPTMYDFVPSVPFGAIAILRFSGDSKTLAEAAQKVWQSEIPAVPFEGKTAIQNMDRHYRSDDRTAQLFGIGTIVAVLLSSFGLLGLASFNITRRTKEIGIRKTLGASSADIVKLLVRQFLRPVLLANLLAWPLAFLAMRVWLAGFDDRIVLSPLFFLAATALALTLALLTVLVQSLNAAKAPPAWALRHE